MVWLHQKVQLIPSEAICPALLHDFTVRYCATYWQEISNVRSLCLRDLPHTYFVPALFSTKKQKTKETETSKGSTGMNTGEPEFITTIIIIIY